MLESSWWLVLCLITGANTIKVRMIYFYFNPSRSISPCGIIWLSEKKKVNIVVVETYKVEKQKIQNHEHLTLMCLVFPNIRKSLE